LNGAAFEETPAMNAPVPLLDLTAQHAAIRDEVDAAVREVFESQRFILGPKVEEFERAIAAYCGVRAAVGVSSGTDALLICLMALGVGPGDEVIAPTYTFFATAGSVARLGARPVFVDIDPASFNVAPAALAGAITERTKAVIPVHLYGRSAEMGPLLEATASAGVAVIEDAAQAIGAEYRGKRAGSLGRAGCLSFFPSKNLGGAGDGGMVTTDDEDLAARLRSLRNHGDGPKYHHKFIGGNFRLDALQAAVLGVKLRHLDAWSDARRRNAERYRRLFAEAGLSPGVVALPEEGPYRHVYNQFVVRVPAAQREPLREFLRGRGIGHEVYYPVPLHMQECFRYLGYAQGDFPGAEAAARETLALPIYPELTDGQAAAVVGALGEFLGT